MAVVVLVVVGLGLVGAGSAGAATGGTQVFSYAGSSQTFTVPLGVTQVVINANGGQGGSGSQAGGGPGGAGGAAGRVTADIPVTPGASLTIDVAGHGADGESGGENGGTSGGGGGASGVSGGDGGSGDSFAAGGGGGGGATSVIAPSGSPLVIAGGGGGGGGGGGFLGEDGGDGGAGGVPPGGDGAGGSGTGAGSGGAAGTHTSAVGENGGRAAALSDGGGAGGGGGGVNANVLIAGTYGGGGQAGTTGGAGAGGGGGGGAGSSFVEGSAIGTPTFATSGATGNGEVIVSWSAPASATSLSASPNPAFGRVTLTATVTPPPGVSAPAPTGTVDFNDGSNFLGQATLSGTSPDTAVLTTAFNALPPGPHTIAADYQGDTVYQGSASHPVSEQVIGSSSTTLSFSRSPAIAGQPLTLTATVTGSPGGGPAPTGQVRFCGTPITCTDVTLNGKTPDQAIDATTLGGVAPGTYPISASYLGDSVYPANSDFGDIETLSVVAAGPLSVTTTSLAQATVASAYSGTVAAAGGVTPYRFSIAAGSLPSGLTLNAATGAITGMPTAPGTSTFTVKVLDSSAPTASSATRALSLRVAPAPLTITTTGLPQGRVGSAYSATLAGAGGTKPYRFSIAAGSLPPGLALNGATGAITGTPTASGTGSVTVMVTDSTTPKAMSTRQALSLTIAPRVQAAVYVTQGGYSAVTSYALGATGNAAPLSDLTGAQTGLNGTGAVTISPTGTVYVASQGNDEIAEYPYGATGNLAPTTTIRGSNTGLFSPSGLALDSEGRLYAANYPAGTITVYAPGASGNATPVATIGGSSTGLFGPSAVTLDARGDLWVANLANNTLLEFAPGANGNATPIATISGPDTGLSGPSAITVDAAGNLLVADTYSSALTEYPTTANGDTTPIRTITGSTTGLNFPDGVDIDSTGNIYVANQNAGLEEFNPQATGNAAPTASIAGPATGLSAPGQIAVAPPLSIRTRHLPTATVAIHYAATLHADLGTTPYRWSVSRGTLPLGLRLDAETGVITGRPRHAGTRHFTVRVTDTSHPRMVAAHPLSIHVAARRRDRGCATQGRHRHSCRVNPTRPHLPSSHRHRRRR